MMKTTTMMKRDYHNDVKHVALDLVQNQSRIFLYAYKIREKSRDCLLV